MLPHAQVRVRVGLRLRLRLGSLQRAYPYPLPHAQAEALGRRMPALVAHGLRSAHLPLRRAALGCQVSLL